MNKEQLQDQNRKKQNELIRLGRMVKETISTEGWLKIGLPLLHKMVKSITGTYANGIWISGEMHKNSFSPEFCKGYTQALMDFENRYHGYVTNIRIATSTLRAMDAEEKEEYTIPMLEESNYSV